MHELIQLTDRVNAGAVMRPAVDEGISAPAFRFFSGSR